MTAPTRTAHPLLPNRFGHFDDDGASYHITDWRTPMPWVNVICTGRYGLVISQAGGGFSWFDDAQHNVLTRWEMDLVRDCHGKFLYLSDRENGDLWSLAPQPCRVAYESFSCVHTQGATTFHTVHKGIRAAWTLTVLPRDPVELWSVELTNLGTSPRRLRLSSYFEWCCNTAPDSKREFHRLFFNIQHDPSRRAIIATKNMWDIRPKTEREHWNKPWPYAAAHAVCGAPFEKDLAIADKELFLGKYGSSASPAAMSAADPVTGGFGRFGDAVGALGGDLTIAPGKSVKVHYLLTIGANPAEAAALVDKYKGKEVVGAVLHDVRSFWSTRLGATHTQTARPDFDLLNNHWLPYQAVSGRLWGRTGYYQQSGAFGFRDQLQDSQVWLPIDPAQCAKQIMLHAERQFADGSVYHWWHALADFGNHTACSDDYLWLPFVVGNYIKETGDTAILDRRAPFVDDPAGGTLLEHCRRSIARAFARTSARGLPFIGSCDWNDGLSAMGIDEKGESVWLAMFLCRILEDWSVLLNRLGMSDLAEEYRNKHRAYAAAVNAHAWDEHEYYKYGTKDNGEWVGASSAPEGKVHLNAQTWAILSGIAPTGRAAAAWAAVKRHLLTPYGPLLVWPAYTVPDPTIGYITRYSPGSRENGGVYMHAATWALAAACKLRDAEAAGRIWSSISPPTRGHDAVSYFAEPYVTPGNVDGPLSDKPGRAGWTWYTGSAAWLNRVCLEWVLGIRPTWEGLTIDPCPPADFGKVQIKRLYRGVQVDVGFHASEFNPGAKPMLLVDGKVLGGCVLEPALIDAAAKAGRSLRVDVRWGSTADVSVKPEGTKVRTA